MRRQLLSAAAWLAVAAGTTHAQTAQDHAFTYQGRLTDGGNPANGVYDLQFKLFDADTGGTQAGATIEVEDVQVADGLFTARLDFGPGLFSGPKHWLEVGVRDGTTVDPYTELAPRNELTSTPYASASLFPWALGPGQISYTEGNVGIGTATPGSPLTVFGVGYGVEHTDGARRLSSYVSSTGGWFGTRSADPLHLFTSDGVSRLTIGLNGGIGIGTTAPIAKLHVTDGVSVTSLVETTGGTNAWSRTTYRTLNGDWSVGTSQNFINDIFYIYRGGAAAVAVAVHPNGNVGIGTSAPVAPLDVNGIARVKTLQITGGGDIAEPFDVASTDTPPRPGHVVVIDESRPGGLRLGDAPYDTKVAGVISGANGLAPGMVLRAEDRTDANGEHAVAMTGRVWCFADASFGAIAPGDRLTTALTAGHAMKAGDPARADGAVIGKAMTPLAEGRGLVLVLVNLQ